MTQQYEFKMDKLSDDMGICIRDVLDCGEPMLGVCTPGVNEKHLFLVGETTVKVGYNTDKQPTIVIGDKIFTPGKYLDDENDIAAWVIEILGSSAAMLLTGESLAKCAKEFAYEIREGLNSSLISAKTLVEDSTGTENALHQFFSTIEDEFKDMSWNIQPLIWDLDIMLVETLVDAGIPSGTVSNALNTVYTFDQLCQMMEGFNESGKYECQLFITEVLRTIPQEELDKRWEL